MEMQQKGREVGDWDRVEKGLTLEEIAMNKQARRALRLPRREKRPVLHIDQILAWADAHYAATGSWPEIASGLVRESPYGDTWCDVNKALCTGRRGLPGAWSLARLLSERRDVRPTLTVERILAWADAHHAATGSWPTRMSGSIAGTYRETWMTICANLNQGRRGLPGGTTLALLLAERRNARNMHTIEPLTDETIVAWADAHHAATGRWPSSDSGPVLHAPGETWSAIASALSEGRRGLPGGMTLTRLLLAHRGREILNRPPDLTVDRILAWADAHHAATGRWPVEDSGPVAEAPGESWAAISGALACGNRGLPGGSSLARLLAERRGARNPKGLRRLTVEEVLAWADAYHEANGHWPSASSGPVPDSGGEDWRAINGVMWQGHRGLPSCTSLAQLLATHRGAGRPDLTLARIRAWAETHREATGRWPYYFSGPVSGVPGETWSAIDAALRQGRRGLAGGMSLAKLFGRSLDPAAKGVRPDLTVEQILAWADAHRAATGRWPGRPSGAIPGAPGEKWVNLDVALREGRRGLPSGTTLMRLLAEHRGTEDSPALPADCEPS